MQHAVRIRDILHLKSIPKISDRKIIALVDHFSGTEGIFAQDPRSLMRASGIRESDASLIRHSRVDERSIDEQFSLVNRVNGSIISFWDKEYPCHLKNIYDPPALLFVRGALRTEDNYSVAIVGTRHPTNAGRNNADHFATELSIRGITVVSGLARGVDTVVHKSTVKNGGRTIAVLGGSIDRIYPRENQSLAEMIESDGHGAVISELPMSTPSHPGFFPRRNRIISGMSLGTLIIESDENGGAMITATTALDQNRELFCIPGSIAERKSYGTNKLIKNGQAKLVQSIDDIIDELLVSLQPVLKRSTLQRPAPQLNMFEQSIMEHLTSLPVHIDAISETARLTPSDALVNLLSLEFKGMVQQLAGKMFRRA